MRSLELNMGYMLFLSLVAAVGGLLFGYDTAVISGTIGQVTEQFKLNDWQQGWYVGCALVGSIVGVSMAGILSDKWVHNLAKTKTVILISHRLANVVKADNIYVLKDGRVAESGSHSELTEKNGVYSRLWNTQCELETL